MKCPPADAYVLSSVEIRAYADSQSSGREDDATETSRHTQQDQRGSRTSPMTFELKRSLAKCALAGCSLLAVCSFGLASARPSEEPKWTWSENITTPDNSPKLLHEKKSFFYALVCISSNDPPAGPIKFTVNNHAGTRFNKAGCWLDAISDIYLAEGHANGTISDLGPTSRQVRPLSFHFSNVAGEETDLVANPPEHPVNVKICIENMARAGRIKFTIKFYGDEAPVDRWEIPQYPINPQHYDCPEFNHVVAIWLDRGDGEGDANNIPVSGTVYAK
jgi:hypothetical protein